MQASFPLLPRSISVLVSGHRRKRKLSFFGGAELHHAFATLDCVLTRFARIHEGGPDVEKLFPPELYAPGSPTVRVMTGQADTVDRYAIRKAHALGLHLDLIVPGEKHAMFGSKPERVVAFGCPQSVMEQDNKPFATRDELALSYADVLVAVWDGDTPAGAPGGVVWLIQRAVAMGLPVLWIDLDGTVRTIADHRVTRHWLHLLQRPTLKEGLLRGLFKTYDLENGVVTESLRRRLNPLCEDNVWRSLQTDILRSYASEARALPWLEARVGWFEQFMTAMFRARPCDFVNSLSKLVLGKRICTQRYQAPEPPLSGPLAPRFEWSDARANIAGRRHGSGTWLLYMLSSAAVFAAAAGLDGFDLSCHFWFGACHGHWKTTWPIVELVFIGVILYSFIRASQSHWHRLWLGHRFVAEQIRYLKMLEPFLAIPAPFTQPLFLYRQKRYWLCSAELWLLQRSLSAGGLPPLYETYELASKTVPQLGRQLEEDVQEQFSFHRKKHEHAHTLHRRMEVLATLLFIIAGLSTATHIGMHWFEPFPVSVNRFTEVLIEALEWLPLFSATLPALGAALHGVMTKLEFGRIAEQSSKVRASLDTMLEVVRSEMTRPELTGWQPMVDLRDDAIEIANLLADENVQWRDLINYQRTELP